MADLSLLRKVQKILYGGTPELMDRLSRKMWGYDSEFTATGKTPDEIELNPQITDVPIGFTYEHASFTFGRFSLPTIGHRKLIDRVIEEANGTQDHYVFPTHHKEDEKNPLVFEEKIGFLKLCWPFTNIVDEETVLTFFDAIHFLESKGYKSATLVIGQDQYSTFSNLLEKYSDEYSMTIGVVYVDRSENDVSATQVRNAVINEDYETFRELIDSDSEETKKLLYWETALALSEQRSTLKKSTLHTINAIGSHLKKEPIESASEISTHGMEVHNHLVNNFGLKMSKSHGDSVGLSVHDYIRKHPSGIHYIMTSGHAMAVVDGVLHDYSGKGADRKRKIVGAVEYAKPNLKKQVQEMLDRVPSPGERKGSDDSDAIGNDQNVKNTTERKRRRSLKRFRNQIDII